MHGKCYLYSIGKQKKREGTPLFPENLRAAFTGQTGLIAFTGQTEFSLGFER
jgi:hypothetical protein